MPSLPVLLTSTVMCLALAACGGSASDSSTRQTPPPVAGAVNVPDEPTVDPAPYLAAFPLEAPVLPRVTGDTPVDRGLAAALVPFAAGDHDAAATALDGLRLDYPEDTRVQLYLGIARLFQDEPGNALELLRPLEFNAPPDVAAEAAWYSLVGIARLRDPSGVAEEAAALCRRGWATSSRACAAEARLGRR